MILSTLRGHEPELLIGAERLIRPTPTEIARHSGLLAIAQRIDPNGMPAQILRPYAPEDAPYTEAEQRAFSGRLEADASLDPVAHPKRFINAPPLMGYLALLHGRYGEMLEYFALRPVEFGGPTAIIPFTPDNAQDSVDRYSLRVIVQ